MKPGKAGVQLNPDIPADFLQPPDGGEFRAAGEAGRDHAEFLFRLAERGEFIEHRTDAGKPHKGHEKVNPVRGLDFGLQFMKEIRGSPVRIGDQRRVRDGGGRTGKGSPLFGDWMRGIRFLLKGEQFFWRDCKERVVRDCGCRVGKHPDQTVRKAYLTLGRGFADSLVIVCRVIRRGLQSLFNQLSKVNTKEPRDAGRVRRCFFCQVRPAASDFLLQHFSHQGFIKPAGQGGKEWLRIRHGNS